MFSMFLGGRGAGIIDLHCFSIVLGGRGARCFSLISQIVSGGRSEGTIDVHCFFPQWFLEVGAKEL